MVEKEKSLKTPEMVVRLERRVYLVELTDRYMEASTTSKKKGQPSVKSWFTDMLSPETIRDKSKGKQVSDRQEQEEEERKKQRKKAKKKLGCRITIIEYDIDIRGSGLLSYVFPLVNRGLPQQLYPLRLWPATTSTTTPKLATYPLQLWPRHSLEPLGA